MMRMPKEKNTEEESSWGSIIKEFVKGLLSSFVSEPIRKLQVYAISLVIAIAAFVALLYGIGALLGSFFPEWPPGVSHILVGIIFLLAGWAYRRYS